MNISRIECLVNLSKIPEFHLGGFQTSPALTPLLFFFLFTIYLLTVVGNFLIISTVSTHVLLQSPMYIFLCNLSFLEIWYTTAIAPTMLGSLLSGGSTIYFVSCLVQLNVFAWLVIVECFILTVMAYDRYVAICYPLHYTAIMARSTCMRLLAWVWLTSCFAPSVTCFLVSMLQFPGYNEIDHFFCDILPLLELTCSDTVLLKIEIFAIPSTVTPGSFLLIIVSYVYIISAIMRIPSATGRHRAFSTCSSHLSVVVMYFGSLITMYVFPATGHSLHVNKALSLLYTVATPLFKPIIYTLRNKDIREIMGKVLSKTIMCLKQT